MTSVSPPPPANCRSASRSSRQPVVSRTSCAPVTTPPVWPPACRPGGRPISSPGPNSCGGRSSRSTAWPGAPRSGGSRRDTRDWSGSSSCGSDAALRTILAPAGIGAMAHRSWTLAAPDTCIPYAALDEAEGVRGRRCSPRWVERVRRWLERGQWLDAARCAAVRSVRSHVSCGCMFAGFDVTARREQARVHRAAARRRASRSSIDERRGQRAPRSRAHVCRMQRFRMTKSKPPRAGRRSACRIIRRARIGLIVPALDRERSACVASSIACSCRPPPSTGGPAPESAAYELAAARPLIERPVVAAALGWLDAPAGEAMARHARQLSALLLGPHGWSQHARPGAERNSTSSCVAQACRSRASAAIATRGCAVRGCTVTAARLERAVRGRRAGPARACRANGCRNLRRCCTGLAGRRRRRFGRAPGHAALASPARRIRRQRRRDGSDACRAALSHLRELAGGRSCSSRRKSRRRSLVIDPETARRHALRCDLDLRPRCDAVAGTGKPRPVPAARMAGAPRRARVRRPNWPTAAARRTLERLHARRRRDDLQRACDSRTRRRCCQVRWWPACRAATTCRSGRAPDVRRRCLRRGPTLERMLDGSPARASRRTRSCRAARACSNCRPRVHFAPRSSCGSAVASSKNPLSGIDADRTRQARCTPC